MHRQGREPLRPSGLRDAAGGPTERPRDLGDDRDELGVRGGIGDRRLWSFTGDGGLDTAPNAVGNTVYVGSSSGELYGLSVTNGSVVWSTNVGSPISAPDEQNVAQPLILVMPFGSTSTFSDEEWVDGVRAGNGWATFVARDLVRAVDSRYRTIASRRGRAIAGLSEGGYGAIDIALHHPHEFSVVESWSGYQRPDKIRSIFGPDLRTLAANDPSLLLPRVAPTLRKLGTFFWFYSGSTDPLRKQNAAFSRELAMTRIAHRYFQVFGGHNWALWRDNARAAYLVAAERLAHA